MRPSFIKSLTDSSMTAKNYIVEFLLYNDFSIFLRRVGRFILRLFRWIPVLWNQEEWDYEYVYDLLEQKMHDLRNNMTKDIWHDQKEVQKGIKQIDICLMRLNRWRNWACFYDYPMDEAACKSAIEFEQKNYDKFWKDFLAWHRGWWT